MKRVEERDVRGSGGKWGVAWEVGVGLWVWKEGFGVARGGGGRMGKMMKGGFGGVGGGGGVMGSLFPFFCFFK